MASIMSAKNVDYASTLSTSARINGKATDLTDLIGHRRNDEIHAGGGSDTVIGGVGKDLLYGDAGNDRMSGGNGHNLLRGGDGNDNLLCGNGSGYLSGDAGDDLLNGGRGNDVSAGGSGADNFVLSDGHDVITDFSPVMARLVLLDFEGLPPSGSTYVEITKPYKGIVFASVLDPANGFFSAYEKDSPLLDQLPGTDNVINSGTGAALIEATIGSRTSETSYFASPSQDFDFVSGYFAAALVPALDRLDLSIQGYDDGKLVATKSLQGLTEAKTLIIFDDSFSSIDQVQITSTVVLNDLNAEFSAIVALDDLLLRFLDGDGDRLQVGAAKDIGRLVASAHGDGAGNTVLGSGNDALTLLGVAPAAVSDDWFVLG